MGALGVRRLEQRNTPSSRLPGTGETVGAGVGRRRGLRARPHRHAGDGRHAKPRERKERRAAVQRRRDQGDQASTSRRMIAAMSSDKWFPGAPSGRIHVETASATGFGGETVQALRHLAGRRQLRRRRTSGDKVSRSRTRIEGFVLAPPLRGLEGLSLRLALQSMGLKEVKADFDCHGTEDAARASLTVDRCALVGPGLGEIELRGAHRQCRCDLLERPRRGRLAGARRISTAASARPGWCWPTRACWSAA